MNYARTALAVLLFVPGWLAAQDGPLLSATMDTTAIHLGERFSVTLTVDHSTTDSVTWPDRSADIEPFEVVSVVAATTPSRDGERAQSTARLTLAVFELGDLEIPAIAVPVTRSDGGVDTLLTDPIPVVVESIGVDESGDIRDIKPPLSIPRNWWLLLPWVLGGMAAVAVAWWLYRRRAGPVAPAFPAPPPRPPHHVALDALDRLERKGLLGQGAIKEFHIELSEIVRAYVRNRWGIDAPDMTTDDLMPHLRRADLLPDDCAGIESLLRLCDLVKFAKLDPGFERSTAALQEGRAAVKNTAPRPTEEAA